MRTLNADRQRHTQCRLLGWVCLALIEPTIFGFMQSAASPAPAQPAVRPCPRRVSVEMLVCGIERWNGNIENPQVASGTMPAARMDHHGCERL